MPVITILFVIAFIFVAPNSMKKLLKINIIVLVAYFILLRIIAFLFSAGRGGRNEGMLEDYAVFLGVMAFSAILIVILGVIIGVIQRVMK
jgi:hypothetical protein